MPPVSIILLVKKGSALEVGEEPIPDLLELIPTPGVPTILLLYENGLYPLFNPIKTEEYPLNVQSHPSNLSLITQSFPSVIKSLKPPDNSGCNTIQCFPSISSLLVAKP